MRNNCMFNVPRKADHSRRRVKASGRIASLAFKGALAIVCSFAIVAVMPACGGSSGAGSSGSGQAEALSLPFGGGGDEASGADFSQPSDIEEPEPSADSGGAPDIDAAHATDGYVTAQAASASRLKFQVNLGDQTYNYDLPNDGTQTVYPLNMGSGSYTFRIMQNTSGSNYVELYSSTADVALATEFDPFLMPNMFCDYDKSSTCVSKAREVTGSASNVAEAVKSVCEFVANNVTYDNAKAEQLASSTGYVPNPDETLSTGKGICFDYAALSAAMLRSMGIPTKIVTGYVGKDQVYHAWIMVYIDGTWQSAQFKVEPNTWSRCDVTFASTGATQYVGDASAYTDKYTY